MLRSAVLGAGALGTILGVMGTLAGEDVVLIDANRDHVAALNRDGATITGKLNFNRVPVRAILPEEMVGTYDLVFVLTKQTANPVAIPRLLPHLHEKSIVCVLQNGIPEEYVASVVGKERTIGGSIMWGAEQREPGKVFCTTAGDLMTIDIGTLDGQVTEPLRVVERWLQCQGKVTISSNLVGVKWMKLWVNAGMSGMSAALGSTYGELCDSDGAMACVAHIADEVVRVSRAKGVRMEGVISGYTAQDLTFDTPEGRAHTIECVRKVHRVQDRQKASMLVDMEKGRPSEIDYIDGEVARQGRLVGVPTPFCDTVVRIVKDFEAGKIPMPTMANLEQFPPLPF